MKGLILLLAIAGLASLAATCTVTNTSLNTIDGRATFAGEVRNDMTADLLSHRIVVAFVDEDGNVLETRTTNGCLRSLQSSASNFFSVASMADEDEVHAALARVATDSSLVVGKTASGVVRISDVSAQRKDESLTVTGKLRNDDDDELDRVRACVVVYGEDGQVIVVQRDNDEYDMHEDDTEDFSVTLTVPDDAGLVDEVSVWVDAERDGRSTTPRGRTGIDVDCEVPPTATATATAEPTPSTERHNVC